MVAMNSCGSCARSRSRFEGLRSMTSLQLPWVDSGISATASMPPVQAALIDSAQYPVPTTIRPKVPPLIPLLDLSGQD
jgi:hypothetical protein